MITAYKYLEGFSGDAEEYERIRDEFWKAEVTEDSDNYILFKRFRVVPINLSNEEFWELVRYVQIDPDCPLYATDNIIERLDYIIESIEELEFEK